MRSTGFVGLAEAARPIQGGEGVPLTARLRLRNQFSTSLHCFFLQINELSDDRLTRGLFRERMLNGIVTVIDGEGGQVGEVGGVIAGQKAM